MVGGLSHIKGTQTTWVLDVLVMGDYIRACTSGAAHSFGIASEIIPKSNMSMQLFRLLRTHVQMMLL